MAQKVLILLNGSALLAKPDDINNGTALYRGCVKE